MNTPGASQPSHSPAPIALTMGEPAGVGTELTLKAWLARAALPCPYFVIANAEQLRATASMLGIETPIREITDPVETTEVFHTALPVIDIPIPSIPIFGEPSAENADAIVTSITMAVDMAMNGKAAAVVTNPIHKRNLYDAGFPHPGHTEFLAALSGEAVEPVMMLACNELRAVPVTTHMSLREALAALTPELIVSQTRITADALKHDFGIFKPRIAIAGLNPHAGESGAMGNEEDEIIRPAMVQLQQLGIQVTGPHPPDAMFSTAKRPTYDAAICMYHDQALIPIKTLDFSGGVNVTLGLPIVRTSPDHGTALDIAGKGSADATSLIAALRLASTIASQRRQRA